jgi:hypothetical protein
MPLIVMAVKSHGHSSDYNDDTSNSNDDGSNVLVGHRYRVGATVTTTSSETSVLLVAPCHHSFPISTFAPHAWRLAVLTGDVILNR